MARPSLPTLTWSKSAVTNIPNCTVQEVLDATRTLLGTLVYWEDKDGGSPTDPTSNPFAYIIMGPKGGSTTENQRITLGFNGTTPFSGTSMVYYNEAGTQLGAPISGQALFNYQPEGGEVGLPGAGAVNVMEPFVGRRSLGWTPCTVRSPILFDGTKSINVWFIESNEIIVWCIENATASPTTQFGFVAGPMWIGATDADGDVDNGAPVPDRIWGSQSWVYPSGWGQYGWDNNVDQVDNPFGTARMQQTQQDYGRCNIFDPANTNDGLALGRAQAWRATDFNNTQVNAVDQMISFSGAMVGYDVNFYTPAGGGLNQVIGTTRYIGTWRQMRIGRCFTVRMVIDSGGSDVAIVRGPNGTNNWDALWFTNS